MARYLRRRSALPVAMGIRYRDDVSAEKVAALASIQARDYLSQDVPVGRYLADQLLVPMAVAGGGGFRTMLPSRHTLTNIDVIQHFLDIDIDVSEIERRQYDIKIF